MLEALRLCQGGWKVRPVCWRATNPDHWLQFVDTKDGGFFVEFGKHEEIPHALRLSRKAEFLGEWEIVED